MSIRRIALTVGMIVGVGAVSVGAAAEGAAPAPSKPLPDGLSSVSTAPSAVCTLKACKIVVNCEARDPENGPACIFRLDLAGPTGRLITRPAFVLTDPETGQRVNEAGAPIPWPEADAVLIQSADPSVRMVSQTVTLRTIGPGRNDLKRYLARGKRKLSGTWEALRGEGFIYDPVDGRFETIDQNGPVRIKLKGRPYGGPDGRRNQLEGAR